MARASMRRRVVGQDVAAEAHQGPRDQGADPARADHAHRLAVEVEPQQPLQGQVALANPGVGAVQPPGQGEDEADGVLGHRVGRVGGHTAHGDLQLCHGGQVHVVEPGRPQRHQACAAFDEDPEHTRVELVIHEGADGREPSAQRRRLRRQPTL